MIDHLPVLIPVSLFLGALLTPICRKGSKTWPYSLAVVAVGCAFAASLTALCHVIRTGEPILYHFGGWSPTLGIEWVLDSLSALFCSIITGAGLFALWHGRIPVESETPGKAVPFYAAVLLLLGGFCGIVLTGDVFNLYVFLEISSLATYALVSIGDKRAPVAGFRYLILGTVGASFYLLGVGFLLMATGSLNMGEIAAILPVIGPTPVTMIALVLIVVGIGLKMALFPLHGWLPDAYTFASSTSTALVGAVGTKVGVYAMIRLLYFVEGPAFLIEAWPLTTVIAYLGGAGILFGGAMAMAQKNFKRMLAYSSIGHIGYIAIGIGLASPLGFIAAVLHALNHAIMKLCLFLISGTIAHKLGHTTISGFDNRLSKEMPWTMAALGVTAISMMGLPPLGGFFSKWYLVLGSVEAGHWPLVGAIIISGLFSIVYFFRVLERVYLRAPETGETIATQSFTRPGRTNLSMVMPVVILSASLLAIGLGNVLIVKHVIVPVLPNEWTPVEF